MNRYLIPIILLLSVSPLLYAQDGGLLTPDEFQRSIGTDSVQLLDVRTSGEFSGSHIKDALQADWNKGQEFRERVQYLDKTRPVLVYCASGGRSHAAADWLRQNDFKNVQELKGGMTAWKLNNKPVEEPKPAEQLTTDAYNQLTRAHKRVLVDFSAAWCPPCKTMEPVMEQLKKTPGDTFKLVTIDAGTQLQVMKQLKIESIPTFIIYEDGKEVWRKTGVTSLQVLKKKLGS